MGAKNVSGKSFGVNTGDKLRSTSYQSMDNQKLLIVARTHLN